MDKLSGLMDEECLTCRSISGEARISPGQTIFEGVSWLVEHAYPTSLLGWIVIVLRRHAEALHELTRDEFAELAELQRAVSRALRSETGCKKEYTMCFAEAPGFTHIHFHVVPRAADLPAEHQGGKVFIHLSLELDSVEPSAVAECCMRLQDLVARSMQAQEDRVIYIANGTAAVHLAVRAARSPNRQTTRPHMQLRGVIFDLDGTLADTIPICVEAFQRTMRAHSGPHLSRAEIESLFGPTEEGMLQRALPEYSPVALETYLIEYERLHTAATVPFRGITALLDALHFRGIKLAVVTGKGPRSADISCRALGVRGYFTHIEAGSSKGIIKPAAIARVIAEWSLRPLEVAYIGDTPADMEAARSAGVVSVGAAWGPDASPGLLQTARPDFLFQAVPHFASWVSKAVDAV